MFKQNKSAFTLVELIVVITILAILWTIAFISLQGYSASARDTRRISDIQNIKKSLELFSINTWKYPFPDSPQVVLYSWDILWTQWIVWENVSTNLSRNLQEKPTDPSLETPYFYSVINSQTQYELLANYEGSDYVNINLLNNIYATSYTPKISWNYNEVFVKTTNFIIPTPSIMNAINIEMDLKDEPNNIKSQIITGWENNIANWSIESSTWWLLNFNLTFTWTIDDNSSDAAKISVINMLQTAYSWTSLSNNQAIANILNIAEEDKKELVEQIVLSSWVVILSSNNDEQQVTTTIPWNDTKTVLLIHDSEDVSLNNNILSFIWDVQVTSSETKFWDTIYFDWVGDYISIPHSIKHNFALNEDFTIDFWMKSSVLPTSYNSIISKYAVTNETFWIQSNAIWKLLFWFTTSIEYTSSQNYYDGNWNHVAWVRKNGLNKIYKNWILDGFWENNSAVSTNADIKIWDIYTLSRFYNWYLDELRISKWIARWDWSWANIWDQVFTPPTLPYWD